MSGLVGIIGAMDCEISELLANMTAVEEYKLSGSVFYKGVLAGKDVVVVKSGVGKVFASIATQTLILYFGARRIINIGVAGSVSNLKIGDIALSTGVVQHDMDTTAVGDEKGLISGINKVVLDADSTLIEKVETALTDLGFNYQKGIIASGDIFVADSALKESIRVNFSALCAEMEGASVGQTAYVNNIPFVVIRSISDDGEHQVEFFEFAKSSAKRASEVLIKTLSIL